MAVARNLGMVMALDSLDLTDRESTLALEVHRLAHLNTAGPAKMDLEIMAQITNTMAMRITTPQNMVQVAIPVVIMEEIMAMDTQADQNLAVHAPTTFQTEFSAQRTAADPRVLVLEMEMEMATGTTLKST